MSRSLPSGVRWGGRRRKILRKDGTRHVKRTLPRLTDATQQSYRDKRAMGAR